MVPFPFSDLSRSKRRPALIVQHFDGEDLLLAQITSQSVRDKHGLPLGEDDFKEGSLNKPSNIRPNKLFTCSKNLILYRAGRLKPSKLSEVIRSIKNLLDQ